MYNKPYLIIVLESIVTNNYCQLAEKKVSRFIDKNILYVNVSDIILCEYICCSFF